MRVSLVVSLALFSLPALAADLTVKVVDPQSAAVSGAQVQLLRVNDSQLSPPRSLRRKEPQR
jgi:hypothetical protein